MWFHIYLGQHVTDCVIVVPGFFGQAERTALLTAANLAGLKVLQLINDYTAVALNKAIYRRKEFNETANYFAIYDMGAYHTTASIISYQLVKDPATRESNPVIQVVGVGYDRSLGGLEMQIRLRDYLAREFNAMKKTKTDIFTNPRAMAKLFKEAKKLKEVLSANKEHKAQVEGLIEEIDFKLKVSRETLESLCSDLFERVTGPLERALKNAQHMSMDVLSEVVLFGGGPRVPKVHQILESHLGDIKLRQYLNMDEAATIGAVYKAADLVVGLKVAKFVIKDAVLHPIQVTFEREGSQKLFKRNLFPLMSSYPQKKVITFNKNIEDFTFHVGHADLDHLTADEVKSIGSLSLMKIGLNGVPNLIAEHTGENVGESKGIKAHFALDDSGVLSLNSVELVVDKNQTDTDEESSFSKLGSTITKLFSGGEDDEEKKDGEKPTEEEPAKETEEKPEEKDANATADDAEKKPKVEPKIVTVKKPVQHEVEVNYLVHLKEDKFDVARKSIETYTEIERKLYHLQSVRNELESFVIDAQQNLYEDEYSSCATEEEIETIRKQCSEISEWMYEDGEDVAAEVYEEKLAKLRELVNPIYSRHWEHRERPDAIAAFGKLAESATAFLNNARNMTKESNAEKDVFTEAEVAVLDKAINDAEAWLATEQSAQNKLKKHETVQLTVQSLGDRMALVDREVKYLINKLKYWKPKVKETPKKKEKETNDTTEEKAEPTTSGEGQTDEKPIVEEVVEQPTIESEETVDASKTTDEAEATHTEL